MFVYNLCMASIQTPKIPDGFELDFENAQSTDAQFEVVQRYFRLKPVHVQEDLKQNTFYYLRGKARDHLILSSAYKWKDGLVHMMMALSEKELSPLAPQEVLAMGRSRKLFLLEPTVAEEAAEDAVQEEDEPELPLPTDEKTSGEKKKSSRRSDECILDMGAFTQLLDAVQRAKLLSNVDRIGHIRDREFRIGEYQQAFDSIDGMYRKFSAAANQREQRLRQEEMDIKSGRVKMSPKKLQEKRARDTAQSQLVQRADNRFLRVLEGLRVLINT